MPISEKDEQLLAVLKSNARASIASLARQLGSSRTTIQDRLNKLEEKGIIKGYRLILSDESQAAQLRAFIMINIDPRQTQEIYAQLRRFHEIEALHSVSGKIDLMATAVTNSPARLDALLEKIGYIKGIRATESAIILATKFEH